MVTLLTTFDDRINRARWWLGMVILVLVAFVLAFVLSFAIATSAGGDVSDTTIALINLLVTAVIAWPATAITVKRLKDRDRPLWLVAVFWAPAILSIFGELTGLSYQTVQMQGEAVAMPTSLGWIIIALGLAVGIWSLIELGILKGTDGPNRHGPDPLAEQS